jgi:tetratricopeptide (TPR) repeat protein
MPHLSEEQTRALARRFAAEIDHLEECAECRSRLKELASQEDRGYRAALARASEGTLRRLPVVRAEKAAAPDLLAELLAMSNVERETALAVEIRFQSYALAVYILKRCEMIIPRNPQEGRELARLARTVTGQVDPRSCGGTAALADLEAYALAMEGESLRTAGEPERALRAFAEARLSQERGGADPELGARIDHLEAVLRRDLGQTRTALELLDRATEAFVALKEHDQLARIVMNRESFLRLRSRKTRAERPVLPALAPRQVPRSH